MTLSIAVFVAARVLAGLFFLLLIVGFFRRMAGRFHPRSFRRHEVRAIAASRYARGEISAENFRQIRDDLKDLL